jgi:hypothetical protein
VFWWFERGGEFMRYEVNELPEGGYVMRIVDLDGTEHVENFIDSSDLSRRQADFERELSEKGWTGPHGWNL